MRPLVIFEGVGPYTVALWRDTMDWDMTMEAPGRGLKSFVVSSIDA